jgi:NADH-quinone oxidoreductase subunit E
MIESHILTGLLSDSAKDQIDRWLQKYPPDQKKSAVLFALRIVQEENGGWLTTELLKAVADYLNIPHIAAYEVATFYSMYDLQPVGRNKIKICTSISCMLRGSNKIIAHLRDRLGIHIGQTTSDGLFTLKAAECLAACGNAPVLQINDRDYFEDVTPEKIDLILDKMQEREAADGK